MVRLNWNLTKLNNILNNFRLPAVSVPTIGIWYLLEYVEITGPNTIRGSYHFEDISVTKIAETAPFVKSRVGRNSSSLQVLFMRS